MQMVSALSLGSRTSPLPLCVSEAGSTLARHVVRGKQARLPGHDADVNAAIYPANQRIVEETENHGATMAVYFMYYDFARGHQTLRVMPPMEAAWASRP